MSDTSSVDTLEAFLDMIGLEEEDLVACDDEAELVVEKEDNECIATVLNLPLPPRCSRYLHPPNECTAIRIDNFCSRSKCQKFIQMAETSAAGFQYITEASHMGPDGKYYKVKLQNPNPHKLSVFEHQATLTYLWETLLSARVNILRLLEDFVRDKRCGPPLGLNPRLRVVKYDSIHNDLFEPHFDATTYVGQDQKMKSLLTVLLYLNDGGGDDFEGGETFYLNSHISSSVLSSSSSSPLSSSPTALRQCGDATKVTPKAGSMVIFEHDLFHAGAPLVRGTKYVLRTDILFRNNIDDEEREQQLGKTSDDDKGATRDRQQEPEKKNLDDNGSKQNGNKTSSSLVSNLCDELQLSKDDIDILDNMGLLDITVECFVSPGVLIIQRMLEDSGMEKEIVKELTQAAVRRILAS